MSSLASSERPSQDPAKILTAIDAEVARREAEKRAGSAALDAYESLASFVKQGWHILEPGRPLIWNWHLDVICDAIERQIRGDPHYRKLVFCVPPGTMKSLLVSVFAPAWEWLRNPERRKLALSNDDKLVTRDSKRMRDLITSQWYLEIVDQLAERQITSQWSLSKDQAEKVNFENTRRGFRQSLSIGAKVTGKRADDIVIDDPLDAAAIINGTVEQVAARLQNANSLIEQALPSRVNQMADARWTLIMQRLHENDPAGRAIKAGWRLIQFQMEFQPDNERNHPDDPRTEPGELMFPEMFPEDELAIVREKMGNHYSAQYQQEPLPPGGGPFKRWYWRFWYPQGIDPPAPIVVKKPDGTMHTCAQMVLPPDVHHHTQSWDMAFKDKKTSSYVVGQLWAELGADSFLLDQDRERRDIVGTIEAVERMSERWPQAFRKLIEDKANGPAVIRMLRGKLAGLEEVNPEGSKPARANAVAPVVKSGNVYLPHPSLHPWVHSYIDTFESVPAPTHWDEVDTTTQYLDKRYHRQQVHGVVTLNAGPVGGWGSERFS